MLRMAKIGMRWENDYSLDYLSNRLSATQSLLKKIFIDAV